MPPDDAQDDVAGPADVPVLQPSVSTGGVDEHQRQSVRVAERYYRLGPRAAAFIDQIDGRRTLLEVAARAQVDAEWAGRLVRRLRELGIVQPATDEEAPAQTDTGHVWSDGPLTWLHRVRRPERFYRFLDAGLAPFADHPSLRWAAFTTWAGLLVTAASAWDPAVFGEALETSREPRWLIMGFAVWVITLVVHESSHAVACQRIGARPGVVGMGLHYLQPVFFVDITDVWMVPSRGRRAMVHAAGPLSDWLMATSSLATLTLLGRVTPITIALAQVSVLAGLRGVLNATPFLRLDGYFVLMEIMGRNNLQRTSFGLLRRLATRERRSDVRGHGALVAYAVLSTVFTAALLVLTVWRLWARAPTSRSLLVLLVVVAVASSFIHRRGTPQYDHKNGRIDGADHG